MGTSKDYFISNTKCIWSTSYCNAQGSVGRDEDVPDFYVLETRTFEIGTSCGPLVTPETVAAEYEIKVEVTDENHIRNPFVLIDYDPNEAEFDLNNTLQGWEDISCPNPNLECSDYDSDLNSVRKCAKKPLGGSISAEDGIITEKITMNVRATGKEKYIRTVFNDFLTL